MFERSLQDVVKGLRAQPTSEGRAEFAATVLQECKKEMASTDGAIKANAVIKVAHLRMLGYDDRNLGDDDSSFHVIETMALQPFKYKRMGYLAASTVLTSDSPVLLLATNSLKKEMQSSDMYVVGLALGSTSSFTSRELARDLLPDVISVATTSIKPYVRKRGTLCLYRLCTRYPEGLREGAYDALRSRLDDSDISVISCAVNAVCELAKANPRNVLPLTPQLFQLLTTSGNNWLTIKVVKLYASLLAVEPRLAKKLLEPLAHIVKTTAAKSLLYECISTVTKALVHVAIQDDDLRKRVEQIVSLCAAKLKEFVRDTDQNLKYLGLVGFVELTKSYPYVAQEHKDLVLLCLNDEDITVRLRALELLAGMATKNSVAGIVSRLLEHLAKAPPGKFRDAVVQTCIDACVDDDFQRVPSCEWFVAVLMDLARLGKGAHGSLLAKQIVQVPMRVQSVRGFASNSCARLLMEVDNVIAPEVQAACAFVACEYFDKTDVQLAEMGPKLVQMLMASDDDGSNRTEYETTANRSSSSQLQKTSIPPDVRAVFIHNAFKLASKLEMDNEEMARLSGPWRKSPSALVRERTLWCELLFQSGDKSMADESQVMGPVHAKAQRKVPLPPGLDLSFRKCPRSPVLSATKISVSFRGVRKTLPPSASPTSSSSAGADSTYSLRKVDVVNRANTYSPFRLQDNSPFILGKTSSAKSKGEKRKKSATMASGDGKNDHHDDESDISNEHDEEEERRKERESIKSKLWSVDLAKESSTNQTQPSIVMAAAAVPSGAFFDADDDVAPKKTNRNGHLTLADVDVLEETEDDHYQGEDSKVEKQSSTSKKKEDKQGSSKKSKKKKKKSSKDNKEDILEDIGGGNTSVSLGVAPPIEADLLDFSEL